MPSRAQSPQQKNLLRNLGKIRAQIEELETPFSTYLGIKVENGEFHVAEGGSENLVFHKQPINNGNPDLDILQWLKSHSSRNNLKFVAAGITGKNSLHELASMLWLKRDVVPYVLPTNKKSSRKLIEHSVNKVESYFNKEDIAEIRLKSQNEVNVTDLVTFDDYKKAIPAQTASYLTKLAAEFKRKRLVFFNATPRGGGVALMRHALIRLFRLLGVDAHWFVMRGRQEVFEITKTKFHNVLQGVANSDVRLSKKDKELYDTWIEENVDGFKEVFRDTDVVVIDDPQPSGLIPYIRRINPKAKIIYRSHIQIESHLADRLGTPQHKTWSFIWKNIKSADCFVSHPIKAFIPANIPKEKTVLMPATTDPLDGLNKPLSRGQRSYYRRLFNKLLLVENQTPLDFERPYIIQIARFDPSKGIPDVIDSFRKLRIKLKKAGQKMPQLVIVGHGSVDDPDGIPMLYLVMNMLKQKEYHSLAHDVKVVRLPHIDQLLNTLVRESKVALQLSYKEGFEIKVTEALMKGKPVIAYNSGGIPLQIQDRITGYLVKAGSTNQVAQRLFDLFTDKKLYKRMSTAAEQNYRRDVLTAQNATNWLFLANKLVKDGEIKGDGKNILELIAK